MHSVLQIFDDVSQRLLNAMYADALLRAVAPQTVKACDQAVHRFRGVLAAIRHNVSPYADNALLAQLQQQRTIRDITPTCRRVVIAFITAVVVDHCNDKQAFARASKAVCKRH